MRHAAYTEKERSFLRKQYPTHTCRWCAQRLGKSEGSLRAEIQRMGLRKRPNERWTTEQDAQLVQLLREGYTRGQVAVKMRRSRKAIDGHVAALRSKGAEI